MVEVAAAAGWPACGFWFDGAKWTDATTRGVRKRLDDSGIIALDIEPIIPADGADDHAERLVAAAAGIGARNILFTSRVEDEAFNTKRYGECCDMAAPHGIRVVCEFLPIFPLNTLAMAARIVADAARPNGGVLIDNLHFSRSGATFEQLSKLDLSLFPYIQIADAPSAVPMTFEGLLDDAVNGRLCPGEGGLPIAEMCTAIPDVPISFEVRSKALREGFSDDVERARHLSKFCLSLA
jgi:sugar phosphate isomerase/epimerase